MTGMDDHEVVLVVLVAGMREAIQAFEAGRSPIDRLAWELKSQISALEEIADREWVDELRSIRNQLEIVSAFYFESGRSSMRDDERRDADDVLGELWAALVAY